MDGVVEAVNWTSKLHMKQSDNNTSAMRCNEVESLLNDFVDGELSEHLRLLVSRHCARCETCSQLLLETQQLIAAARSLASKPIPREVSSRLRRALKERVGHESRAKGPLLRLIIPD